MADILMVKLFIGDKQYDFARELDAELIRQSQGRMSIVSAMKGAFEDMLYDVADEVMEDRRSAK